MRYFFPIMLLLYSCAPARFVKPLAQKEHAINISAGGPLIKFGNATIPVPFLTTTYGYGIDSTCTAFGSFNVTSALFGNIQMETGVLKQVLKQRKFVPGISLTPTANIIYRNKNAVKFYPALDLNFYWEYNKRKNYFYAGASNWFELSARRAYGEEQPHHWLFSPMIGHTFTGKKWNFNIEAKIIAPHISNKDIVVDYQTPFGQNGAFGLYIGYTRRF